MSWSIHFSPSPLPTLTQSSFMKINAIAFSSNFPSFTLYPLNHSPLSSQRGIFKNVSLIVCLPHLKTLNSFSFHLEPRPNSLLPRPTKSYMIQALPPRLTSYTYPSWSPSLLTSFKFVEHTTHIPFSKLLHVLLPLHRMLFLWLFETPSVTNLSGIQIAF